MGENPIKGQMVYQNLLADMYVEGDLSIALGLLVDALQAKAPDRQAKSSKEGDTGKPSTTNSRRSIARR